MDISAIQIVLIVILLIIFNLYLKKTKQSILKPNPWLILFYLTLLPTFFGFLLIPYHEELVSFGTGQLLSDEIKYWTSVNYLISWIITFILFCLGNKYVTLKKSIINNNYIGYEFYLMLVGIILIAIDFINLPAIPLIDFLNSGIEAGLLSRGNVIDYQINNGIPGINLIIRNVPIVIIGWLYFYSNSSKKYRYFLTILALYLMYNFLLLAKGFFIIPLSLILWIKISEKNYKLNIRIISILFLMLFLIFLFLSNEFSVALESMIKRVLIVQAEGAFLIREFYQNFDINALSYGMPFAKYLNFNTAAFDPSVTVVKDIFGDVSGWVNINSYYIGQGSVMVGPLVIFIGPLLIFINAFLIYIFSILFKRCNKINLTYIGWAVAVISMPLNTNFALIMYFKPFFTFIISMIFLELMVAIRLKIKNE